MPAYLPECATYIQDGCNFKNGNEIHKLLEISTDGVIQCLENKKCMYKNHMEWNHMNLIAEIKCPVGNG